MARLHALRHAARRSRSTLRANRGRSPAFNSTCFATFAFAPAPELLPFLPVQPFGVSLFRTALEIAALSAPVGFAATAGLAAGTVVAGVCPKLNSNFSGGGEGRESNDAE